MQVRTVLRGLVITTVLAVLAALLPQMASAGPKGASGRYLVVARSSADYASLRAKAVKEGARVLRDLPQAKTIVVDAPAAARTSLAADRRTLGVARDRLRRLPIDRSARNLADPGLRGATQLKAKAPAAAKASGINPDPAFDYKGLLWDYRRIGLPKGWKTTAGSRKVTVGVADTGLDFTHRELAPKVKRVIDFTASRTRPSARTSSPPSPTPTWPPSSAGPRRPTGTATGPGSAAASPPPSTAPASTDRAQGQPGRPQDLPVVRLGLRLEHPGRVHHRRQPRAGHRQPSPSAATTDISDPRGQDAVLPGLYGTRGLRPQQGQR
jgi:hypothetical protein